MQEGLETWLAYWEGEVAGYFELEVQDGGHVEIALFGLLPQMFGKGLGSAMLSLAVSAGLVAGGHEAGVASYLHRRSSACLGELPEAGISFV